MAGVTGQDDVLPDKLKLSHPPTALHVVPAGQHPYMQHIVPLITWGWCQSIVFSNLEKGVIPRCLDIEDQVHTGTTEIVLAVWCLATSISISIRPASVLTPILICRTSRGGPVKQSFCRG